MSETALTESELARLRRLADEASPPPWTPMIEGRDHVSGDSFMMMGRPDDRDEDLYLVRDSGPAGEQDYEFVAAARNLITALLDEIDRLRNEVRHQ